MSRALTWAARALLEDAIAHPELFERVQDLDQLPAVHDWPQSLRDLALDELVDRGVFTEAADGALCIDRRKAAA